MKNLNLLVLRCRDLERSRKFYEVLGLRFVKHAHGNGPEHYSHEDDRGVFELYPATTDGMDSTAIGFATADLHGLHTSFTLAGFSPEEIHEQTWGRTFVVRDPDHRRVEIKQPS
jgi:catechol 2,3-dioxygenase-like lactoylglutathione lyase family enzyme